MVKNLITYLKFGNCFCGIEHTTKNNVEFIYATLLKKIKNTIEIEKTLKESTVEYLCEKLPKKQHAFLIINNDNVLTKQIQSNNSDSLQLVQKAFPNIDIEAFYYDIIQQGDVYFVSVCRKSYVEKLIESYQDKKLFITNISLSNNPVSCITNFAKNEELLTTNAKISIDKNSINKIERSNINKEIQYDINGLQVKNNYVLSLSGALDSLLQQFISISNIDAFKQTLLNEFKHIRFFSQFSKFALILILGLLLINFFFFNYYFTEVNTLQQATHINQASKQKVLLLNEEVGKSQKMVEDILKSSYSNSSFYLNAIVHSLPNSILLSEFNYQPLKKQIKKDKVVELNQNNLLISGTSNNSILYSEWISNLESLDWVNRISVIDYGDSKSNSSFKLKIDINYD